ncbi:MAG: dihydrolipoyllysine-residue succinyltransferase [Bacteroidetes bacterium HGW-Bacteroidetes-4]|jgi:2-oxoglutarate dehydrogenase E2 component (dihydrolipoamide succinyltransferase)|nr:MAG: dihydrolipoyllysine-residue succinyltransferase [Bacteroidetes bacterium HGW-Bacteroidetes-4]
MSVEIKIPSPGESITEVVLATWFVDEGDYVKKNQDLAEVESDKATLTLTADASGTISLKISEGETINVGAIAALIDDTAEAPAQDEKTEEPKKETPAKEIKETPNETNKDARDVKITPLAKKMLDEKGLSVDALLDKLHRITSKDVDTLMNMPDAVVTNKPTHQPRNEDRKKLTPLRKKLSERLVHVKNQTAMLTTFNEVNMQPVMELRNKYKNEFAEKFGVKLGFMSFFAKAAAISLGKFQSINSMIDGEELVSFNYADIGIAVQTPKGLMVPVIRDVDKLSLAQTELEIARMAQKARDAKISLEEMSGGTFTITNGGVFGSLLSTPIINPPQAAILGMHNILDRPVAENGQVVIRPMMYLALSYDHRIVDGKDSVGFLLNIKELIENPGRMLFNGKNPLEQFILG